MQVWCLLWFFVFFKFMTGIGHWSMGCLLECLFVVFVKYEMKIAMWIDTIHTAYLAMYKMI